MDYIDARVLLSREEPLEPQEAVDILNSWRSDAENYNLLLQTQNASVSLRKYMYYSDEEGRYIFKPSEKRILSPAFARKFFEFQAAELTTVFLDTLEALTFPEDDPEVSVYAWPYYNAEIVFHLSAKTITNILLNWKFVFDCEVDQFGMVYNTLYEKLSAEQECTDILAVNSFNLHDWGENTEHPVEEVAKHYHFANFSVTCGDNSEEDVYFRKNLVHYLYAYWQNLGEIVSAVLYQRAIRNN